MLKLKELKLNNIGRFVEPQIIEFSDIGNLTQVDGENNNTGGSSGSAKSTIFNSIEYLFGLNDIPTTVLQSRLTKDGISVSANCDWDGKNLNISRSKSKGLVIEVHGQVISGNNKLAEEKLDEIIAMPRNLFRSILHKRQGEGGFFLKLTPKQVYEFLTDCLGLSNLRIKLSKIEDRIKHLSENTINISNELSSIKAALRATLDAKISLGLPPVSDMHENVISKLRDKTSISNEHYRLVKSSHDKESYDLEQIRPQISAVPFNKIELHSLELNITNIRSRIEEIKLLEKDRQAKVHKELSELHIKKTRLEYQIDRGASARIEANTIAVQIKQIRKSMCPTCERDSWSNDLSKTKEASLLQDLIKLKQTMDLGSEAETFLPQIVHDIAVKNSEVLPKKPEQMDQLTVQITNYENLIKIQKKLEQEHQISETNKNRELLSSYIIKEKELKEKHSIELTQAIGQYDIDRRALEAAESKLNIYNQALSRYNGVISSLNLQENKYNDEMYKLTLDLARVGQELLLAEESKRAIKSYASCSFDNALEQIGNMATKIVRNIPNMSTATIQLEGLKETKEGKVKEEVNAVISTDGEIGIPIRSLSGGEKAAIDLAIDLSVIDLIESETGKGIDMFILDEPFNGLGSVEIEMTLEVLKNSNMNKHLIVVDHNPIIKEFISSKILVVRNGLTSKVVQ